jgi:hypothetical protein
MPEGKRRYAVYEVSGRERTQLGTCYGNRPSRCLRKIAFKADAPRGVKRIIDVEEMRPGLAERPVVRYTAESRLAPASASKRAFKEQQGIPDPEHEIKIEILHTEHLVRRKDKISAAPKVPVRTRRERDASPAKKPKPAADGRRRAVISAPNGYAFQLVSSTKPKELVYEATFNGEPLPWSEALELLQQPSTPLSTALQKLFAAVGKEFGEFCFRTRLSSAEPRLQLKFKRLSPPPEDQPLSFAPFERFKRQSKLPHNLVRIESQAEVTFVPEAASSKLARYGSLGKFFSSETAQTKALLAELAAEAQRRSASGATVLLAGSSRPIHWAQFQVR